MLLCCVFTQAYKHFVFVPLAGNPKALFQLFFIQELSDLHVEALEVVANCLIDSESIQLLHSSAGLTRLMTFILTSTKSEIHLNAVKCITRVAQSCKRRRTRNTGCSCNYKC